jgi:hypothetical protein
MRNIVDWLIELMLAVILLTIAVIVAIALYTSLAG